MKSLLLLAGVALLLPTFTLRAADAALTREGEARAAVAKGVAYLRQQQQPDGSIGNPANLVPSTEHPALTAMPLLALQRDAAGVKGSADVLQKGYAFLRSKAQPDGGIYTKGLSNYNTSVVLMALLAGKNPQDEALIEKAHSFIVGEQAKDMPKPETNGGIGYGVTGVSPRHPHPDLDNTLVALQALAAYRQARPAAEKANDLNWKAAIEFISRCQNLPETNSEAWASGDPANKGGFIYYPGLSNAPKLALDNGKEALRSYGTMTYAGLLSFIYADLPKSDQRVTAALDWLTRNYTLDENPAMGKQGIYYYYHLATRGLTAAGVSQLTLADGRQVDWRNELANRILSLQTADGSWVNAEAARWMEADPVLVTSYCVLALETLLGDSSL